MAGFKEELINAQLNTDDSGQSTVAGLGVTEVKLSKTFQEDSYFFRSLSSYYDPETVRSAKHHTRHYFNTVI